MFMASKQTHRPVHQQSDRIWLESDVTVNGQNESIFGLQDILGTKQILRSKMIVSIKL